MSSLPGRVPQTEKRFPDHVIRQLKNRIVAADIADRQIKGQLLCGRPLRPVALLLLPLFRCYDRGLERGVAGERFQRIGDGGIGQRKIER